MDKDLATFTIDFDALNNYRDKDNNDLPIYSFIGVYEQIGIYDFIKKYYEENNIEAGTFSYANNIFVNPDTILKIRRFVKHNWETFDISIDRDQHVFWKLDSHYGKEQHYVKRLTNIDNGAVDRDFLDCCPGADPEIADNVVIIRIHEEEPPEVIDVNAEEVKQDA